MREVDAWSHPGAVELLKTLSIPGWPCIRPTAFSPPWAGPPHRTGITPVPAAGLNPEPTCVLLFHCPVVLNTLVNPPLQFTFNRQLVPNETLVHGTSDNPVSLLGTDKQVQKGMVTPK